MFVLVSQHLPELALHKLLSQIYTNFYLQSPLLMIYIDSICLREKKTKDREREYDRQRGNSPQLSEASNRIV